MKSRALYPGTFDPITKGHLDIIERAANLFGSLTVLVADSAEKKSLFTMEERVQLIQKACEHLHGLQVASTSGLVVDYARKNGVHVVVRGLRAVSDFDYELSIAAMNSSLFQELDTVFLPSRKETFFVSSRLVKEVAKFGGDIRSYVPASVSKEIIERLTSKKL